MDSSPELPSRRWLLRRWLNRLEVDRAVFYAIATRAWQFLAGPISMVVIATCYTPELQGYFYTFASLMGMQSLVELGLHGIIINVSSHEWARLQLDANGNIVGEDTALRRLAGLKRFVVRWYAVVGLLFFIVCGIGGAVFLSLPSAEEAPQRAGEISWMGPWFCLVALNSLLLWAWAYTAMLEGCNQVIVVNRVRLLQFISGSLAVWASMIAGLGLWAAVISVAVRLAWDLWLIAVRYRRFWQSLSSCHDEVAISWRNEIWPLQWKMAVLGVAGYFAFGLFSPVMFHFHSKAVAGQMGMTWTILTAVESAAYAWIYVRTSLFGSLAAKRDWREMDRVFFRLLAISWGFYLAGVVLVCVGLWVLNSLTFPLAQRLSSRLLPLTPTIVLAAGFLLLHLPRCQTIYVRAHKQDPFLVAGLITNVLIAILVIALGREYGPLGAGWGLLAVVALINVPWWHLIFLRCRRVWHSPESSS